MSNQLPAKPHLPTEKIKKYVTRKSRILVGVLVVGVILVVVGALVQLLFINKYGPKWWGWAAMWSVGILLVLFPLFLLALLHERQRCCTTTATSF